MWNQQSGKWDKGLNQERKQFAVLHQQNMKENRDIMEMKNGVNNLP